MGEMAFDDVLLSHAVDEVLIFCKELHDLDYAKRIGKDKLPLSVLAEDTVSSRYLQTTEIRVTIAYRENPILAFYIQGTTKRRALGCENFLPGPAWLLLSKTGPPFSGSL